MANRFIHFLAMASAAILVSAQEKKKTEFTENQMEKWSLYKYEYNKNYDLIEDMIRMETFYSNVAFIERHKKHYRSGVNHFADMTEAELMELNGFKEEFATKSYCKENFYKIKMEETLPRSINWAEKGFVSPVGNQAKCASDYAFSAVGALESQIAILHQKGANALSVQQVLDCTRSFGNHACKGGFQPMLYTYLSHGNGIESTADYPYLGISQACQLRKNSTVKRIGLSKMACTMLPAGNEEALKKMVATYGPVPIVFKAGYPLFFYQSGIYNDPNCEETKLNHPVLVVGYGTDKKTKTDYWIIKNSWGTDWGEDGYFRTLRNSRNHCGVASIATMPHFTNCS